MNRPEDKPSVKCENLGDLSGISYDDVPDLPRLLRGLDALSSSLKLGASAREALRRSALCLRGTAPTLLDGSLRQSEGHDPILIRPGRLRKIANIPSKTEQSPIEDPDWPAHLEDLGKIAMGGLGEVRRVLDRDLNRVMVMKLLRADIPLNKLSYKRFLEEAQVTAQLEHPGIVPVHGFGHLHDGRVYFTMKEVQGRTLDEVIHRAHDNPKGFAGPALWQLVDVYRRVCETVAHVHSRGIIHRDLKPANVMVGDFGEVLVLDWGLAKLSGVTESWVEETHVVTRRSASGDQFTLHGSVVGTPAFMAPEQARGHIDRLGPATDVYSLGAMLFQILTGCRPFGPGSAMQVVRQVMAGPPCDSRLEKSFIPKALRAICLKAMSRESSDRYGDAGVLAEEIRAYLEGAKARERAHDEVRRADKFLPKIEDLQSRATLLRRRAEERLALVSPEAPSRDKHPGWYLEDEAERLEQEAELLHLAYLQCLRTALNEDAQLEEAHQRIASFYHVRHVEAESAGDRNLAARFEVLMRAHDRGAFTDYLRGVGALHLPLAQKTQVRILAYVLQDRRLVLEEREVIVVENELKRSLPVGSYLLELGAEGKQSCRYPVRINRQGVMRHMAPGKTESQGLELPSEGSLGPMDVYVPEGTFRYGGDADAFGAAVASEQWLDAFVIRKFPITNGQYIQFLNDLLADGREDDALSAAPRERDCTRDGVGSCLYGRDEAGLFVLQPDPDGHHWQKDWPVVMVDWFGATSYAQWLSEREGLKWQLPSEMMWEKAARGVDGRLYPWGGFLDPAWANVRESRPNQTPMAKVDSFPVDESPFGVRGVAGNTLDWCLDSLNEDAARLFFGEERDMSAKVWRGGSFGCSRQSARLAKRDGGSPLNRDYDLGFRLARWF